MAKPVHALRMPRPAVDPVVAEALIAAAERREFEAVHLPSGPDVQTSSEPGDQGTGELAGRKTGERADRGTSEQGDWVTGEPKGQGTGGLEHRETGGLGNSRTGRRRDPETERSDARTAGRTGLVIRTRTRGRQEGRVRRRITVYLPPDLATALAIESARRDVEMSDLVAETLRRYFGQEPSQER